MEGHKIGYIRVSSVRQNRDRQLEGLRFNQTFVDTVSGRDNNRPALTEMLKFVRKGDHVVVHSFDRIARNVDDLSRIISDLNGRGISIEFLKEKLNFTGTNSPMATLLISVLGAFADFERSLIRERQLDGIAIAKQAGAYKGRKREMTDERIKEIKQRVASGDKKSVIARDMKISRETLYQYL